MKRAKCKHEKKCKHEIDLSHTSIADWLDELYIDNWEEGNCEVGVTCRKCGVTGVAVLSAEMIRWNDELDD